MQKSDLKNGQVVRTNDDKLRIVWGKNIVSMDGGLSLDQFYDDLTFEDKILAKFNNIIEIYSIPEGSLNADLDYWLREEKILYFVTLLWKRYVELTLQEVADKLGISVDKLKIKDDY